MTVLNAQRMQECLDACLRCLKACENCAAACLTEPEIAGLRSCIRLDRDCADVCALTAQLLMRGSDLHPDACLLCAVACARCAAECEKHARHHEHCRVCAEACRACETICRQMAA
ncbi:four-helix bundle copper-binding protein [Deinococcus navajonensis]|uniref:Four-helix bundle copper-binding protein n=1 Tax=Deinococcus navajonensis TaxID=309884 RepID=A0ABV8XP81_9DEIO